MKNKYIVNGSFLNTLGKLLALGYIFSTIFESNSN